MSLRDLPLSRRSKLILVGVAILALVAFGSFLYAAVSYPPDRASA